MIGMGFLGMGAVVAACLWLQVLAPVAIGIDFIVLIALFCWGGLLGRIVVLAVLAFLAGVPYSI